MQHSNEFMQLCDEARAQIEEVSVDEVAQMLDNNELPVLIDVRETAEFVAGHIPQAKHLSRGIIEIHVHKLIPTKDTPAILYCGGGNRSALSAANLKKMGYNHVKSMAGGVRGWHAAGYEFVKD